MTILLPWAQACRWVLKEMVAVFQVPHTTLSMYLRLMVFVVVLLHSQQLVAIVVVVAVVFQNLCRPTAWFCARNDPGSRRSAYSFQRWMCEKSPLGAGLLHRRHTSSDLVGWLRWMTILLPQAHARCLQCSRATCNLENVSKIGGVLLWSCYMRCNCSGGGSGVLRTSAAPLHGAALGMTQATGGWRTLLKVGSVKSRCSVLGRQTSSDLAGSSG